MNLPVKKEREREKKNDINWILDQDLIKDVFKLYKLVL